MRRDKLKSLFGIKKGISSLNTSNSTLAVGFATSVTYDGVTFNFDKAMQIGTFVTGKPFVISAEAFNITSITPISEDIESDGHVGHGAMKDPYTFSDQGFDSYIANAVSPSSARFGNTPYTSSKNIDPEINGNISISLGEETTIAKSVRLSSVTSAASFHTIEKYVLLTVLASDPGVNAFTPTATGTTKHIYTTDDIDWTVFRSLDLGVNFTKTPTTALATVPAELCHFGCPVGERQRRFRIDAGLGIHANSNYSADITPEYCDLISVLHSEDYTQAQKTDALYRVIEHAIQIEGMVDRGFVGGNGAGQGGGWYAQFVTGAFALGSSAMLTKTLTPSNMSRVCEWATSAYVGTPASGKLDIQGQTFFTEQIGMPFIIPDENNSMDIEARYGVIAGAIVSHEVLAIMALQNGPSGETGVSYFLEGGSDNNTNVKAAALAWLDRYRLWTPFVTDSRDRTAKWNGLYDVIRPVSGHTAFTSAPDQLPLGNKSAFDGSDGDQFTGGSAQISWDYATPQWDYSSETETDFQVRYSLDGVQWIETTGLSDTGSITGLLKGTEHYCGARKVSASGNGLWSPNYSRVISAAVHRNVVNTTGAATSAAPTFTTTPTIHAKLHPNWNVDVGNWTPVSGTFADEQIELACGLGYVDGEESPTFTFQWKRDAVDIDAADGGTSQFYTRVAADAGTTLTCAITPSNATSGVGTPVTTAGVACPSIPALPSTRLIDTDFKAAFAINYETQLAAMTGGNLLNATVLHDNDFLYNGNDPETAEVVFPAVDSNIGALIVNKTGQNPGWKLPFKNSATAGRTYNVTAEVVYDPAHDKGNHPTFYTYMEIVDGNDAVVNTLGRISFEQGGLSPLIKDVSDTVVIGGAASGLDLDLRAILRVVNNTGGTGYDTSDVELEDGPALTYLLVEDANPAITRASTSSAKDATAQTTYTFNAVTASDGTLIVHIGMRASPVPVISGVTADGASMTLVGQRVNTSDDSLSRIAAYAIEDWTGDGDVDIVVSLSTGASRCGIVVESYPNADIANMTYKSNDALGAGASTTITVDETEDGANTYYFFMGGSVTTTWSGGPTETIDETVGSNSQTAAAEDLTATASGTVITASHASAQRRVIQAVEITP